MTARRWTSRSARARNVAIASTSKRIESRTEGPLMDQRAHDGWRRVIEGISFHELYRVMARFVSTHRDSHNEGLWKEAEGVRYPVS